MRTIELTASQVRTYKACKRLYELEYLEQLRPIEPYEAFEIGSAYHDKVEQIINTGRFERTTEKTDAMAQAFQTFAAPQLDLVLAEQEFKIHLAYGVYLKGKIDGIQKNGIPVEHKTSGVTIDERYIHKLNWDEQVSIYMLGLGVHELMYTVCQKPTIRQKQNETLEDYLLRCEAWYDESKMQVFKVVRSKEELEEKRRELIALAKEIRIQKNWYCNPSNCKIMGCRYESICLNYDPEYVIGFERKIRMNEELSL